MALASYHDPETAGAMAEPIERLYQLGMSRLLHGDYQQAVTHFTAALNLAPGNAFVVSKRGEVFTLLCAYERAIADFTAALRLGPPNPAVILLNRANALHRSGAWDRAIADCSAALELEHLKGAYLTRADAYAALGSYHPALADLSAALALSPEDDAAFFQRGNHQEGQDGGRSQGHRLSSAWVKSPMAAA